METLSPRVGLEADSSAADLKEFGSFLPRETRHKRKAGVPLGLKLLLGAVGVVAVALAGAASFPRAVAHLKEFLRSEELEEEEPVPPVEPYVKLGLPTVEEAEERMPQYAKDGKKYLGAVAFLRDDPAHANLLMKLQLAGLAAALSNGEVNEILGLRMPLENVAPFNDPEAESDAALTVRVTGVLAHTYRDVLLEVLDEASGSTKALRVMVDSSIPSPSGYTTIEDRLNDELQLELQSARQACADTPPSRAARHKGIAVPLQVAKIAGLRPVTRLGGMCISNRVQLMEPFQINLQSLWVRHRKEQKPFPPGVKGYIARQLLLATLYLQETHVAHNDINMGNIFVREDGSLVLGNFSSSVLFGKERKFLLRLSGHMAEPQAALEYLDAPRRTQARVTGHPQANMWALGAVLYELFTDGQLPYGYLENCLYVQSGDKDSLKDLIDRNPPSDEVKQALDAADVPSKWRDLICKLTRVKREERITAEEIIEQYPELIGLK